MHFKPVVAFRAPGDQPPPDLVLEFAKRNGMSVVRASSCASIIELVNRSFPACVIFGSPLDADAIGTCRTLKGEPFSAVIPVILFADGDERRALEAMEVGADELLTAGMSLEEKSIRLQVTLNRADRDVSVHPSTRLPGTAQIERDITERIRSGQRFAVCYADLDHFKEFNDRYGYNRGDGVISLLAKILRDVVKAYAPTGFIGHIGGDDFIFNVPLELMEPCCEEILEIFDELIPWQYTADDRRAGSFLAKDRRGNVHQIPLMSLSIGVVTNRNRVFSHPARVSELATEMKSYAKTLPGSVYAVDRRSDDPVDPAEIDRGATENSTAANQP
ncbi:MAG TPA: diguanylate cyclase [Longimicrobiales bacterium]|nr:diguanylate cyclase [Longimicrobiales bacterium]